MARGGILLFDGIGPVLGYMAASTAINVEQAMSRGAEDLETYAKLTAPWADRTGMARAGLQADVYLDGGEIVIALSHSVDYGLWLELIQDGAYAVILPTIEALGPRILEEAGAKVTDVSGLF